jgi:ABC-2 type transport system permease protein
MLLLARRELFSAGVVPSTWLTYAAAWFVLGLAFRVVVGGAGGQLRDAVVGLFDAWGFVQHFLAPLFCMRLLSEERRSGTFETLMTAPVADYEVVGGKFLAAWTLLAGAAAGCLVLPLLVLPFGGSPDFGQLASGFLAALGSAAVLCALGVFASAMTSSQVLAAFLSLVLGIVLSTLPSFAAEKLPAGHFLVRALARGSLPAQLREGAQGVVDVNHVAFQLAFTFLFLLFAVRALESRKWR